MGVWRKSAQLAERNSVKRQKFAAFKAAIVNHARRSWMALEAKHVRRGKVQQRLQFEDLCGCKCAMGLFDSWQDSRQAWQ